MRGIRPLDLAADEFFCCLVRRRDRGFIVLQVMLDSFVVMAERDPPGAIGKLACKSEVGLEVHSDHITLRRFFLDDLHLRTEPSQGFLNPYNILKSFFPMLRGYRKARNFYIPPVKRKTWLEIAKQICHRFGHQSNQDSC